MACALITPVIYLFVIALSSTGPHPGYDVAVSLVFVATGASLAGICLSVLSLRRASRKGWGLAGLVLSTLALLVNCFALGNA